MGWYDVSDASDNYEILWLGYNEKPNFDRIWGWLKLADGRHFAFYGKRGRNLNFKLHEDEGSWWGGNAQDQMKARLMVSKQKGFKEIELKKYIEMVPTFVDDLEAGLTMAIIADNLN